MNIAFIVAWSVSSDMVLAYMHLFHEVSYVLMLH